MGIAADIQGLEPSAVIELFEMEMPGGEWARFHAGTNSLSQSITWQGKVYTAAPVQAEGFEMNGRGQFPRPKIRVANVDGLMSQAINGVDLSGYMVTRKRTLARYLDAVNFAAGNPEADPNVHFADDVFYIDRRSVETRAYIEFELASSMDVTGMKLPRRQIIQNACTWRYRGSECGYTGGPVATALDVATSDTSKDVCGKRLASCKLRFGSTAVLPFGGFPAAGLVRS